uniref:Uncharacterized protein n=1 Tax=Stegastes partitus TaxID=144197 RepID=A0A3B5BF24_9TELE
METKSHSISYHGDLAPQHQTGLQPQTPHRTGLQPQTPHRTGLQPQTPHRTGLQPQSPPHRTGLQPQNPHRTGLQPQNPHRTGLQPQIPHRTRLQAGFPSLQDQITVTRMNSPRLSRESIVGDAAVTGVVGAHVGHSDHPQGKYLLCNSQIYSLHGSYNNLLAAKQDTGLCVIMPGYQKGNQNFVSCQITQFIIFQQTMRQEKTVRRSPSLVSQTRGIPPASPASADPPVRHNSQLLMPVRGAH